MTNVSFIHEYKLEFVGNLPLFSARVSHDSSADVNSANSGDVKDSAKPSCGCLGRDAIANAAAKVGPAVVNISVPHAGMCSSDLFF